MTAVNQLALKYLDEQNIFTAENRFNIDTAFSPLADGGVAGPPG